jgi:hypothetical protein
MPAHRRALDAQVPRALADREPTPDASIEHLAKAHRQPRVLLSECQQLRRVVPQPARSPTRHASRRVPAIDVVRRNREERLRDRAAMLSLPLDPVTAEVFRPCVDVFVEGNDLVDG